MVHTLYLLLFFYLFLFILVFSSLHYKFFDKYRVGWIIQMRKTCKKIFLCYDTRITFSGNRFYRQAICPTQHHLSHSHIYNVILFLINLRRTSCFLLVKYVSLPKTRVYPIREYLFPVCKNKNPFPK